MRLYLSLIVMHGGPPRLYRRILRTHRYLPVEMRSIGDDYVKAGLVALFSCLLSSEGLLTRAPYFRYPFRIPQAQRRD